MTQVIVMIRMMVMVTMEAMKTIHNKDDTQSSNLFQTDNNRDNTDDGNDQEESPLPSSECQVAADCFTGIVTDIVDGDTLDVNNV
jgi:hypothetical protein